MIIRLGNNKCEKIVYDKYTKAGYKCLKRGWPDFCFYNDDNIIFVEVKKMRHSKSKGTGLSQYQAEMIDIFTRLGINVYIEYV
jgi:hypothetical protein